MASDELHVHTQMGEIDYRAGHGTPETRRRSLWLAPLLAFGICLAAACSVRYATSTSTSGPASEPQPASQLTPAPTAGGEVRGAPQGRDGDMAQCMKTAGVDPAQVHLAKDAQRVGPEALHRCLKELPANPGEPDTCAVAWQQGWRPRSSVDFIDSLISLDNIARGTGNVFIKFGGKRAAADVLAAEGDGRHVIAAGFEEFVTKKLAAPTLPQLSDLRRWLTGFEDKFVDARNWSMSRPREGNGYSRACYLDFARLLLAVDHAVADNVQRVDGKISELRGRDEAKKWLVESVEECGNTWSSDVCSRPVAGITEEHVAECKDLCRREIVKVSDRAFGVALERCVDLEGGPTCVPWIPSAAKMSAQEIQERTKECSAECKRLRVCANGCRGFCAGTPPTHRQECADTCFSLKCEEQDSCAVGCAQKCRTYSPTSCFLMCVAQKCE